MSLEEVQQPMETEQTAARTATTDNPLLDLAFAMDCTGSMGSYIHQAQENIRKIVQEIVAAEKSDIHLALVEYRDHPPQDHTFVTRVLDFTPSVKTMKQRLDGCSATGGGDAPEAVADALHQVLKLNWRPEAAKICVFIADAPPHGLTGCGDQFPNGCPDGIDPMQVARQLAQKGVTVYMVGCEPCITPYKEFFMSICHITGGQYVPLGSATLLAKVIIGGASEEISLQKLMEEVNQEVQAEYQQQQMAGMTINEDLIAANIHQKLKSKGVQSKQLRYGGSSIPQATAQAKAYSNFSNMADVKSNFKENTGYGAMSAMGGMGAAPPSMAPPPFMGAPAGMAASPPMGAPPPMAPASSSSGGFLSGVFGMFGGGSSSSPAPPPPPPTAGGPPGSTMFNSSPMMPQCAMAPPGGGSYDVVENDLDEVQTNRMVQRAMMMNNFK